MKIDERAKSVVFVELSIEHDFNELERGPYEDQRLAGSIREVITKLKENPEAGVKIPRRLWPREYIVKYAITNLWKYDLIDGWRLIYFIRGDKVAVVSVLIEWMGHTHYNRTMNHRST